MDTISLAKKTILFGMDRCSDGWMNQWMDDEWMNQKDVCRTAAATPGLLIMRHNTCYWVLCLFDKSSQY